MIYGNPVNMDFDFTAPKGPRITPSDSNKNIERGNKRKIREQKWRRLTFFLIFISSSVEKSA